MFRGYQGNPWRVCARIFLLAMVSFVVCPTMTETFGSSQVISKQHVSAESQCLSPYRVFLISERASPSMVGTIMALLATFDEAGVLPPEGTTQANQVIHGLIQLQSALMKSPSPELAVYRIAAVAHWRNQHKEIADDGLGEEGLTDRVLAALILNDQEHPMWENPKIVSAVQAFNVTRTDWRLIVELFHKADAVFREQGRSIHKVYDVWRMSMPGGKS